MGTLTANRKMTRQVIVEIPAGLLSELKARDLTLSNVARASLTRWFANYERVCRAWPDPGERPSAVPFLADDEFQEIIAARTDPASFQLDESLGNTRAVAVGLPEGLLTDIGRTGINISTLASRTVARWLATIDRWTQLRAELQKIEPPFTEEEIEAELAAWRAEKAARRAPCES